MRYLRWLVFSSSTYLLYAFVASILAALMAFLIWNWNKKAPEISGAYDDVLSGATILMSHLYQY